MTWTNMQVTSLTETAKERQLVSYCATLQPTITWQTQHDTTLSEVVCWNFKILFYFNFLKSLHSIMTLCAY